jgi:hypothetical protein
MNITIHRDGQNYGPYSLEEAKQNLAAGSLLLTDLAFVEGASEWTTLNLVPGIAASSAPPPPPPRSQAPPSAPVQDSPTAATPVKGGNKVVKSCLGCGGLMVVGVIVLAVISAIGGKGGNTSSNSVSAVDSSIPTPQKTFTALVDSFKAPYEGADTEIKKTNVRFNRKDALANYFSQAGSTQFQGWIGRIQKLTTESDGSAFISIQLAGTNIEIQTWNNSLSDILSHTMIQRSNPLYQSLMNLKEGDQVTITGTFIHDEDNKGPDYIGETSMTEEGSMTEPEFLARFSQISKQ